MRVQVQFIHLEDGIEGSEVIDCMRGVAAAAAAAAALREVGKREQVYKFNIREWEC